MPYYIYTLNDISSIVCPPYYIYTLLYYIKESMLPEEASCHHVACRITQARLCVMLRCRLSYAKIQFNFFLLNAYTRFFCTQYPFRLCCTFCPVVPNIIVVRPNLYHFFPCYSLLLSSLLCKTKGAYLSIYVKYQSKNNCLRKICPTNIC